MQEVSVSRTIRSACLSIPAIVLFKYQDRKAARLMVQRHTLIRLRVWAQAVHGCCALAHSRRAMSQASFMNLHKTRSSMIQYRFQLFETPAPAAPTANIPHQHKGPLHAFTPASLPSCQQHAEAMETINKTISRRYDGLTSKFAHCQVVAYAIHRLS